MIYSVYAYKDIKIGFLRPFVMENDAVALREFASQVNKPDFLYGEDFELYRLGSYDAKTGALTSDVVFLSNYSMVQGGANNEHL